MRVARKLCGAHPRVRGEHRAPVHHVHHPRGSSPRPRGARVEDVSDVPAAGLIPASAGSTRSTSCRGKTAGAHPRVRGEHFSNRLFSAPSVGSSPRPRGALSLWAGSDRRRGLIPASAGSTGRSRAGEAVTRAHPRVRGEHLMGRATNWPARGSSPRPRGAPERDGVFTWSKGLIPASAGSTSRCVGRWRR